MSALHNPTGWPWKNLPDCNNPRLPLEHLVQAAYDRAKKQESDGPEMSTLAIHLEECLQLLGQLHTRKAAIGRTLPATLEEAMAQGTGG